MLVTVLYRMAGSPEVTGKVSEKFTDCTDGSWYADAVLWASANKIVDGYEDGTYKPTKAISRQEMAKVLYGYDKIGGKTADGITEKLTYTDVDAIGEWGARIRHLLHRRRLSGRLQRGLQPEGHCDPRNGSKGAHEHDQGSGISDTPNPPLSCAA